MRPVDLLKQLHIRQGILAAGAERLAGVDLRDEVLRLPPVAPVPDRLREGTLVPRRAASAVSVFKGAP
jgi:hypothetical protein